MSENVDPKYVDKRMIELPRGGLLEVEMTELFIRKLMKHFELESKNDLTDDHIRMFVWGSLNSAVEKAEKELNET